MGHALIIAVTLLWVLSILVHRLHVCRYWRAHDRRVQSCQDCSTQAECQLYDKFAITKPCQPPYNGQDRRCVSVVTRHRARGLISSA